MDDARAASPASEAGTADELLDRLLQCDAQLVELLRTASRAMLALSDEALAERLKAWRAKQTEAVAETPE